MTKSTVDVTAPANHCILVICPNYWAKAPTLNEAIKKCVGMGGKAAMRNYAAFIAPADVVCNEIDGGFWLHKDCDICQEIVKPKNTKYSVTP